MGEVTKEDLAEVRKDFNGLGKRVDDLAVSQAKCQGEHTAQIKRNMDDVKSIDTTILRLEEKFDHSLAGLYTEVKSILTGQFELGKTQAVTNAKLVGATAVVTVIVSFLISKFAT